jgi:hypothetical protein
VIANYEHYSSGLKDFEVYGSGDVGGDNDDGGDGDGDDGGAGGEDASSQFAWQLLGRFTAPSEHKDLVFELAGGFDQHSLLFLQSLLVTHSVFLCSLPYQVGSINARFCFCNHYPFTTKYSLNYFFVTVPYLFLPPRF